MAQNPGVDPQIPLTTFAGYVSYEDPVSLPAGASPACSDMVFQPGGTSSRPCLQKQFVTPLGVVTVTYGKSSVDPRGIIRNYYLDSAGNFWMEIVAPTALVAAPTVIFTTAPGSYAKSITANGREYVAISDGLHGTDIPYQLTGNADGTVQIDRVTQDGPGAPPTITNLIIPAVDLTTSTGTITLAVDEIDPENADPISGFFTSLNVYTTSSLTGVEVGQFVTISGTGNYNVTGGPITAIFPGSPRSLIEIAAYIPPATNCEAVAPNGSCTLLGSPGSMVVSTGPLQRNNNIVSGTTASPHQLQPGYQVQITNAQASQVGDSVNTPTDTTIVIDNENLPGIATVTVGLASGQDNHGLIPGCLVSITGVKPSTVGTSISTIVRAAQVVTVVMSASTGLSSGAVVTVSGVIPTSFNGIWQLINVTTTMNPGDTLTYAQVDVDVASSNGGGTGTIAINWPESDNAIATYFQVIAAPTPTSFQVAISYPDGSWTTGSITFAWDGQFFVQTVPTPTTFTYQQYGPNATAVAVSGNIVATPYGQAAPGQHQMTVFFIDRQGGITGYAPPVTFQANGGQYLNTTNIPIGPSPSTVARAVAFTGSQGALFFYIPSPPQENGQLVGTATQINDNTTTAAIFDFGDPTLFRALGISIQGNNLANQIVLDGALGFGSYGSRLFAYGQRNVIDNLLNMGFDGGYLPNMPTLPTGWTGGGAGTIAAGHYGDGWQTSATPLTQSMYEDWTGAPIASANDDYTFRAWIGAAGTVTATISSVSTSFSSAVTLTATGAGFLQGNFSTTMPVTIPSDMILGITGSGVVVDEMRIIFSQSPFVAGMIGSYVNNPEGFDAVSGPIGPEEDTHQVLDLFILRNNLYMLTRDPEGRLHQTSKGITEPADWDVDEVAANCGAVSAYCTTRSQADDASAAGGEEFAGWMSATGYRLFGGEEPGKVSQEIQRPEGQTFPGAPVDLGDINKSAFLTVWSLNDPDQKVIYLGIPSVSATAPSLIYMLSYLGLDSASEIIANPPIHKSLSGKLVATDLGRKWSPWNLSMNGAALMLRGVGNLKPVFFNGNGTTPNTGGTKQFGNVYTLNPTLYSDQDYGQMFPFYTCYGMPDRDTESQLQLGGGLKVLTYQQAFFSGIGYMNWSVFCNSLATIVVDGEQWNPWPLTGVYLMSAGPVRQAEWPGGQATAQQFFFSFASSPDPDGTTANPVTDNAFSLSKLVAGLKINTRQRVAGSWP